jgi:uncharacterized FlaG/YvyC family protein
MDIGRVQPAGAGAGTGVDHLTYQPGLLTPKPEQRELIQAVKALNGSELFGQDSELTFVFDRNTRKALVRVVDKNTRELIMQLPPESVLKMAQERTST